MSDVEEEEPDPLLWSEMPRDPEDGAAQRHVAAEAAADPRVWLDPKFLGSVLQASGCPGSCCEGNAQQLDRLMGRLRWELGCGVAVRAERACDTLCRELRRGGAAPPQLAPILWRGAAEAVATGAVRFGLVPLLVRWLDLSQGWPVVRGSLRALAAIGATEEASALNAAGVPEQAVALLAAAAHEADTEAIRLCCQLLVTALLYDGEETLCRMLRAGVVDASSRVALALRGEWAGWCHSSARDPEYAAPTLRGCMKLGLPRDTVMLVMRFATLPRTDWWPAPRQLPAVTALIGLCEAVCRAAGDEVRAVQSMLSTLVGLLQHPHSAVTLSASAAVATVCRREAAARAVLDLGVLAELRPMLRGGTPLQQLVNKRWLGCDGLPAPCAPAPTYSPAAAADMEEDEEEGPSPNSLFIPTAEEDGGADVGGVMLRGERPGEIARTVAGSARRPINFVEYFGHGCVRLSGLGGCDEPPLTLLTAAELSALRRLCLAQKVECRTSSVLAARALDIYDQLARFHSANIMQQQQNLARELCRLLADPDQRIASAACNVVGSLAEFATVHAFQTLIDHGAAARLTTLLAEGNPHARRKASIAFRACLVATDRAPAQLAAFAHRGCVRRLCYAVRNGDAFHLPTLTRMLERVGGPERGAVIAEARSCLPPGSLAAALSPDCHQFLKDNAEALEQTLSQ